MIALLKKVDGFRLIYEREGKKIMKGSESFNGYIFCTMFFGLNFIGTLIILTAIAPSSDRISIAVINLETSSNLSSRIGDEISEHIRTHLSHLYTFDVMDKNEMNGILNKQDFLRPKGCKKIECHPTLFDTHGTLQFLEKCGASDHDAALEIGWMLGVEKVLIGLVNKLEERYTISVKIIEAGMKKNTHTIRRIPP